MTLLHDVQFIPATGEPKYAIIPYEDFVKIQDEQVVYSSIDIELPLEVVDSLNQGMSPIKAWRTYRHMTQPTLAKASDISVPYLSQLENKLRTGTKEVLKRIAQALQIKLDLLA